MHNQEFRSFLKSKIENSSFSLNKIARQAGISPTLLSRAIKGERNLSAKHIAKLAPVLNMKPTDLLKKAGYKGNFYAYKKATNPSDEVFHTRMKKLTPEGRKKLNEALEQIEKEEMEKYKNDNF